MGTDTTEFAKKPKHKLIWIYCLGFLACYTTLRGIHLAGFLGWLKLFTFNNLEPRDASCWGTCTCFYSISLGNCWTVPLWGDTKGEKAFLDTNKAKLFQLVLYFSALWLVLWSLEDHGVFLLLYFVAICLAVPMQSECTVLQPRTRVILRHTTIQIEVIWGHHIRL